MRTKKTIITAAVNRIPDIEKHQKFKITLSLKDGQSISREFKAKISKSYPTIKNSLIGWVRSLMQTQEEQESKWKKRELIWDYNLKIKNIEKLDIRAIN